MEKDFDKWNESKKVIHHNNEDKFYHEREVWWCSLGINIGFEQDGKDEDDFLIFLPLFQEGEAEAI